MLVRRLKRSLPAILIVASALIALPASAASPPVAEWARGTFQVTGDTWFGTVMLDPTGNLCTAGAIRSPEADFGNGVKARDPKPDSWNGLLVKYDPTGAALWARTLGPGSTDSAFEKAAMGADGSIYCVGYIGKGTFDFGNGVTAVGLYPYTTHENTRKGNVLVVKYDQSGNAVWARTVVAATDSSAYSSVSVDTSGNVVCVGNIDKRAFDFGDGFALTAGPDTDGSGVVVKYDPSGKVLWARTVPTKTTPKWHLSYYSVDVDSAGNIYAVGTIGNQTFDFGNGVTAKGDFSEYHAFLVKYGPEGDAQWVRLSTFGVSQFASVEVDPSGNVYATGYVNSNLEVRFGNGVSLRVPGSGSQAYNLLLVKYDSAGNAQWARSVEKASCNSFPGVVKTDTDGNVYVAGLIERDGAFDFGQGVTVKGPYFGYSGSAYGTNGLLLKYDPSGTPRWAQTVAESSSETNFWNVLIDSAGQIYVAASMQGGTVGFGPGVTVSARGLWDNAVLVKYVQEQ